MMATTTRNSVSVDTEKWLQVLRIMVLTVSMVRLKAIQTNIGIQFSIPRFVLALDYKFNSKWILGAEIEFESGGTGTAYELENTENGEYETEVEKGGEVAIEQFHIYPFNCSTIQHTCRSHHCPGRIDQRPS